MGLFNKKKDIKENVNETLPAASESATIPITNTKNSVDYKQVKKPVIYQPEEKPIIDKAAVSRAFETLLQYKAGKENLDKRIIENEQWYKMRHWDCMPDKHKQIEPRSAWLFNSIANKHADAMDNFPTPNILPREEDDKREAEMLTSIVPVVLEQNNFEKTYSGAWDDKLKFGTGVYGVFWDNAKLGGLGDIAIEQMDILNLFWEPGVKDIQKSRNMFSVELMDNDLLVSRYPKLSGKLGGNSMTVNKYIFDDAVKIDKKSLVVDWYYKKVQNGKTVLHYCKFVNGEVLFATENETKPITDEEGNVIKLPMSETGWYDHAKYPFVFDVLFGVKGSPAGFGYIDVGKDAQAFIDRGNQAILMNMLVNAKPRHFIRKDAGVNLEELTDLTKDFVECDGNLGQDSIMPINGKALSSVYVSVINNKIDELKETTGNRDISTGGSQSGVTAASAIAAMQEAGSKLSRDSNKAAYREFKEICLMVIELIRQFYDLPRCFRIMGQDGVMRFENYSNENIAAQSQGTDFGIDMGVRVPLFDITVSAEKQSSYSKMAQNELALQFYQAGFFNPQLCDQALAVLDMMDFDRKEFIMNKITANGTMYQKMMAMQQQMLMMAQIIDNTQPGSNMTAHLMAQFNGNMPMQPKADGVAPAHAQEALGGENELKGESKTTRKSRERVANATSPT